MPEAREPFLDSRREWRMDAEAGGGTTGTETLGEWLEWLRTWEGGVEDAARGDEVAKRVDFGLPVLPAAWDDGTALVNGLLRRDSEPLEL